MDKILKEVRYGTFMTYVLIVINILIFFLALAARMLTSDNVEIATFLGGSNLVYIIQNLEIWRIITANFVHIDITHIGLNMIALFYYGRFLENFYTSKRIFLIFMISGIIGTSLALVNFKAVTFGASAGIYGFIGVMLGNNFKKKTYSPGLPIDIEGMLPSIVIWLIFGFMMPGISGLGHIGGVVGGFLCGLFFNTVNTFKENKVEKIITNIFFYILIFILLISFGFLFLSWIL